MGKVMVQNNVNDDCLKLQPDGFLRNFQPSPAVQALSAGTDAASLLIPDGKPGFKDFEGEKAPTKPRRSPVRFGLPINKVEHELIGAGDVVLLAALFSVVLPHPVTVGLAGTQRTTTTTDPATTSTPSSGRS